MHREPREGRLTDPAYPLRIVPDSISRIDDPAGVTRALHEEIELKYFYEGESTLLIGGETVEVRAGDLVVINPYELHSTIRFGEDRGRYRLLMMDPDFFMDGAAGGLDLRAMIVEEGLTFKTLVRDDARVRPLVERAVAAYAEGGPYWRFAVRGAMLELFALLLSEYSEKRPLADTGDFRTFETVEPALRKIREDYAQSITLEELAALCNVSKCHFCRVFRKVTGQSAMRYLTEYRLKIADLMLTASGESIGTIAERCGFLDLAYFCQCYKSRYGIPPSRKRTRK